MSGLAGPLGAHQKKRRHFFALFFELIVGVDHRFVRGAGVGRRGRREELEAKRRALAPSLRPSCLALAELFNAVLNRWLADVMGWRTPTAHLHDMADRVGGST
jgi:hypothetical protein